MSSIRIPHAAGTDARAPSPGNAVPVPSPALILLLATAAGLAVAAIYYAQPLLGVLGADLGAGPRAIGLVPTLTQLGYAAGIVFLAPLGDRFDRRSIIVLKAVLLAAALLAGGLAPGIGMLLAASLLVGLTATLAQDIVPAAATIAPEAHRGKVVGTVMTGLLLGILLSRVVSGFVAEHLGWRAVFVAAAVSIVGVALAAWRGLPRFPATTGLSYGALLGSLLQLWRRYPALRRAALAQGLLAVSFSAFWSTLAVMLHDRFALGSAVAGAFGLAGVAGALAAPLAGRLADRRSPEWVALACAMVTAVSFALMLAGAWLPGPAQLWLIVAGAIGFDFGVQSTLVAHQTRIYGLEPAARSRLNAVLFTGMFTGMAAGAVGGSLALSLWGWAGVMGVATLAAGAAVAVRWHAARMA